MAIQPVTPVYEREVYGTPQNDVMQGGAGNDRLLGVGGDDQLHGGEGDDSLFGGQGNDTLDGGPGVDVLIGSYGHDSYLFGRGSDFDGIYDPDLPLILVDPNVSPADLLVYTDSTTPVNDLILTIAGTSDRIYYEDGTRRDEPLSTGIRSNEMVRFADGTSWSYGDVLARASSQPVSFTRIGTANADTLFGAQGSDSIYGRDGNDTIQGAWGNDYLAGENGDDLISGWDGDDVIDGGAGNDALDGGNGSDQLVGGSGNDNLNGGGNGRDLLQGGAGNDVLTGGDALSDEYRLDDLYRLYRTVLNREPDVVGLTTWNSDVWRGEPLEGIAARFMASPEAEAKFDRMSNDQFLDYLYQTVLGRAPDARGYADWSGALNSGVTRTSVLTAFSQSSEFIADTAFDAQAFQTRQFASEINGQVYRVLRATLGTDPNVDEFIDDARSVVAGASIEWLASRLVRSTELQSADGGVSKEQFVTAIYQKVLGRAPDAQGLEDWVGALNQGMRRETLVVGFCESPEFKNQTAASYSSFLTGAALSDRWSATLDGGSGDDVLISDNGSDVFSFQLSQNPETDNVYGLQTIDVLRFDGFGYANGGAALTHMTQVGQNVQFADGGHNIIFHNSTLAQVAQSSVLVSG